MDSKQPASRNEGDTIEANSGSEIYEIRPQTATVASVGTGQGKLVFAALATLVAAITWASFAEIGQVTRGSGQIIASSKTQVIQAPDGGVIAELFVREGDVVERSQVLAKLDTAKVEAAFKETEAKRNSLRASVARLRAEVLNQPLNFPAELNAYPEIIGAQRLLYQRRRSAVDEEIEALRASQAITREELAMNESLLKTGDVSQTEVLRLRRQLTEMQGQITNRRNKYFQDAQAELAKAEEDLAGIQEASNQRKASLEYTTLTASLGGGCKKCALHDTRCRAAPGRRIADHCPSR